MLFGWYICYNGEVIKFPLKGTKLYLFLGSYMKLKMGFTLIELLVVVLIIGILAAIALPQYQKAVEKSKAAQALSLIRSIAAAQENYYMANGSYASGFDELAIDIPWSGTTKWIGGQSSGRARSNDDWSAQIYHEAAGDGIAIGRLTGPYQKAGLIYLWKHNSDTSLPLHTLMCWENSTSLRGKYCKKVLAAKPSNVYSNYFLMP